MMRHSAAEFVEGYRSRRGSRDQEAAEQQTIWVPRGAY
jgi:hypothetical protein